MNTELVYQTVRLTTRDNGVVCEGGVLPMAIPAQGVIWGNRAFFYQFTDEQDVLVYKEDIFTPLLFRIEESGQRGEMIVPVLRADGSVL